MLLKSKLENESIVYVNDIHIYIYMNICVYLYLYSIKVTIWRNFFSLLYSYIQLQFTFWFYCKFVFHFIFYIVINYGFKLSVKSLCGFMQKKTILLIPPPILINKYKLIKILILRGFIIFCDVKKFKVIYLFIFFFFENGKVLR